jgi:hypothetical protein
LEEGLMASVVKRENSPIRINGKPVIGVLDTYDDATAKWTYIDDSNWISAGLGDRSTFTSTKQPKVYEIYLLASEQQKNKFKQIYILHNFNLF